MKASIRIHQFNRPRVAIPLKTVVVRVWHLRPYQLYPQWVAKPIVTLMGILTIVGALIEKDDSDKTHKMDLRGRCCAGGVNYHGGGAHDS